MPPRRSTSPRPTRRRAVKQKKDAFSDSETPSVPSPGFKRRLRERVLTRVRDGRGSELDKRRRPVADELRGIVTTEFGEMRSEKAEEERTSRRLAARARWLQEATRSHDHDSEDEHMVGSFDDEGWLGPSQMSSARPVEFGEVIGACGLFDGVQDQEDFINGMVQEIEAELSAESAEIDAALEYEDQERFEAEQLLALLTLETETSVLCPVCRQRGLVERGGTVQCECGLSLGSEDDALTLSGLNVGVARLSDAHRQGGCTMEPVLQVEQRFGLPPTLFVSCAYCDFLDAL